MLILFQLALTALVVLSFALVIGAPVVLAGGNNAQPILYVGSSIWVALVLLVGVLNFFVV
ncbi:MAG: photosystem II core protein PsbZ [Cyanobacteria bacterium QS_8_64_29]|jgi:photosystem II PsbZ protein|nr:MAG: photosystem II core protein PsbZ [Cyanobacteria bacterium QS_8_64_29]